MGSICDGGVTHWFCPIRDCKLDWARARMKTAPTSSRDLDATRCACKVQCLHPYWHRARRWMGRVGVGLLCSRAGLAGPDRNCRKRCRDTVLIEAQPASRNVMRAPPSYQNNRFRGRYQSEFQTNLLRQHGDGIPLVRDTATSESARRAPGPSRDFFRHYPCRKSSVCVASALQALAPCSPSWWRVPKAAFAKRARSRSFASARLPVRAEETGQKEAPGLRSRERWHVCSDKRRCQPWGARSWFG
jgi:hypothetical protein